ncbi:MAG: hypothetical protein H0W76_10300 [Pyrinomonadaceae bacterium]|nr:hypothetical protein [Pyrinomonadaceae bacterium]
MPKDMMNITEAIRVLKISRTKMAQMLEEGHLAYELNPLDKREKLVSREDVKKLSRFTKAAKEGAGAHA